MVHTFASQCVQARFCGICIQTVFLGVLILKRKKKRKAEGYYFVAPRRRRRKSLAEKMLPVWFLFAAAAALGCLAFLIYALVPGGMKPGLGRGDLRVCLEGDQLTVSWPQPINASASRLYRYDLEKKEYVLYGEFEGSGTTLSGVRANEEILLQLQAVKYTVNWVGKPCERTSRVKSVTVRPMLLDQPVLQKELDPEKMVLTVSWNAGSGNLYEVCRMDENGRWETLSETGFDSVSLSFGDDIDMPDQEHPASLAVRTMRRGSGCVYYSALSEPVVVQRDDLSGTLLALNCETVGDRMYRMTWEETRGDTYEVQQWSQQDGEWITKKVVDWSEERVYETGRLPSGALVRFRVVAYHADHEEDFTVEPDVLSFRTDISPLYCTIWPIIDLDLMAEAQQGAGVAKIPAGEALCVLAEENGWFQVRYRDHYGYVDSRYCMINLPEYLGDWCEYDIANSYSSIFRVHGYDIPGITGTVVEGYEGICLKNDDFLVPYLYPCSQLLLQAAKDVWEDGYTLRIYDAFRPNEATRFLYNTMSGLLNTGVSGEITVLNANSAFARELAADDFRGAESMPTFGQVMMNSQYQLSWFLAASVSAHNRGIALDLTLVDRNTDELVGMQTDMHDLSWYSSSAENNENADLLALYMKRLGFNGIASEWWHFQDDDTREEIGLNSYLTQGVAVTGWKKDDAGWRYRLADGSYYSGTTATIDGGDYTFNADGYVMSAE